MADTGYNWDAAWSPIDAAIVLTQGGTTTDSSATLDLDGKAAALISIDADYSDDAKATGGLFVYIFRETGDGSFEAEIDAPWGFEMPFVQNGVGRVTFQLSASQFQKFKVFLDWDNSTGGAVVTVRTDIKYATIPVAT